MVTVHLHLRHQHRMIVAKPWLVQNRQPFFLLAGQTGETFEGPHELRNLQHQNSIEAEPRARAILTLPRHFNNDALVHSGSANSRDLPVVLECRSLERLT